MNNNDSPPPYVLENDTPQLHKLENCAPPTSHIENIAQHPQPPPLDDDDKPVWNAKGIAQIINRTERQVFHMLEKGFLPARKVGGVWVSTRRALRNATIPA